ncbi:MAG: 16S rRNA (cytosine(1402)-N(4))-methyltransferase RsmH [Bryobacteraceae bacterium]
MEHYPVLLRESLDWLAIRPDSTLLDATCGLGNHSGAMAAAASAGLVISNDRDADSIEKAQANIAARHGAETLARIKFHHGPFSRLKESLAAAGVTQVDGLLADLGVSRYQLTEGERGFSLNSDGPLDMRMDRTQSLTASEIVNYEAEKALADLIYQLGEERRSRQIARAIVRARPILSTLHLAKVIETAAPRTGKLHPATLTFMALRLAVNEEQEELDALLEVAPSLVKPGGRIVIIAFMSLEDRKVKQSFQSLAREGRARLLTKHVVRPSEEEIRVNPASRSARLRALEVTGDEG